MKFCPNCGTENNSETRFCKECGHDFNGEVKETPQQRSVTISKPEMKALTKTQKIIAAVVAVVLVALFGGYKIGEKAYSKENQVNHYIEILASADAERIADAVKTNDPNFKVTAESLAPYVRYLEENKSYVSQISSALRQDSLYNGDEIYLEQKGKTMLFFDNYDLVINPVYFNVGVNVKDAAISINGENVATSTVEDYTTEVGPYAPGVFELNAAAEINGYEFENKTKETILYSHEWDAYLHIEGVEFEVSSNQDIADVYLDGEKIGNLTDGSGTFGPVSWSEGMMLELGMDFPSGTLKSESVELSDYNYDYYYLSFPNDFSYQTVVDELFGPLTRKIVYMSEADESSLKEKDNEDLASYLTGGKDNELYTRFTEYAKVFRDNADAKYLSWNLEVTDVTQTDVNLYTVTMDFELTTTYSYDSNRDDLEEAYEYTFVIESFEDPDSWDGIGFTLSEISSKVDTLN